MLTIFQINGFTLTSCICSFSPTLLFSASFTTTLVWIVTVHKIAHVYNLSEIIFFFFFSKWVYFDQLLYVFNSFAWIHTLPCFLLLSGAEFLIASHILQTFCIIFFVSHCPQFFCFFFLFNNFFHFNMLLTSKIKVRLRCLQTLNKTQT